MKSCGLVLNVLLLAGLCGCAHLATVKTKPARIPVEPANNEPLERARDYLAEAEHDQPLAALGQDLVAAKIAYGMLEKRPEDDSARNIYNFAVARVEMSTEQILSRGGIQSPSRQTRDVSLWNPQNPSTRTMIPVDTTYFRPTR